MSFKFNPFTGKFDIVNTDTDVALIPGVVYVASTAEFNGTPDGTLERPFATYQDAIDYWGVPTTQAEYNLVKQIIFLDGADYAENVVFPMGIWIVQLGEATHTGTLDWEINSNERFGSTVAPRLDIEKNQATIPSGMTGDVEVYLKSGGTAVSLLYLTFTGLIVNGNVTISDGVNIGTSCASLPIVIFYRAAIFSGGTFKNRLCFISLSDSSLNGSALPLEIGTISSIFNGIISSTSVLEARSSTTVKTIRGLSLNTSGGVTWDSTGSVRNWNVDAVSANEVLTKITSFPSNPINLVKIGAEAIGYDNSVSGLTATDVQAAIDELDTNLGDYLPLAGGTLTGDTTLDTGVQLFGDPNSAAAAPTFSFTGFANTGIRRATISSANRVVLVADGTDCVEYGALGAITRVPFLFGRQDVAWGASTVDGGIKNVVQTAINEDATLMWPNRDYNAIFITEHGERNRTNYDQVWTDDGEPVLVYWGSQTPNVANYDHYLAIGTDHTNGYSRIVTGTGWDLHVQVDNTVFEGDIDMNGFDIDNIKQAINDGGSAASPAFVTGDSGWYGTNAKTMFLSISGSDVMWFNVNGVDILDNDAAFGDIQELSSGLGVFIDQSSKQIFFGDWRNTTSETYVEADSSVGYVRTYVAGVQVLDIQANGVEFNRALQPGAVVDVNSSTYNIIGNESFIRVYYTATGVCTLQLPTITAAMDRKIIPIADYGMNAGTNKIQVDRGGSDTIEGSATSYEFLNDGEAHGFMADYTNTNWKVV